MFWTGFVGAVAIIVVGSVKDWVGYFKKTKDERIIDWLNSQEAIIKR